MLRLGGPINGGPAAASTAGPGTVWMVPLGNNSYTGRTLVASADGNGSDGILQVSGFSSSVIPGGLDIGQGTSNTTSPTRPQVQALTGNVISDTTQVNLAADGLLVLNGFSETIAQLTGTGSVSFPSSLFTHTIGDAGNFTFGGIISGAGNVNKVGIGTMTYTAANTYTGQTRVSGGTLLLSAPAGTGAIKGPLTIGLGVGAPNTATVQLGNGNQISNTTLPITINSDGKLDTGTFVESVGPVTINGGNFVLGGSVQQFDGLTMNGGTISGAGTLLLRASNVVATATAAFGVATINANVELSFAPDETITVNSGSAQPELTINGIVSKVVGPTNLIKTGTGTLRLAGSAANTYGGSTTIERGVLELGKAAGITAITGPIVIGNGTDAAGSAALKNLARFQIGGAPLMTINASGVYEINPNAQASRLETIGGLTGSGSLVMNTGPQLNIDVASGATYTYSGTITSPSVNGATAIVKVGAGEQALSGTSPTYAGQLLVSSNSGVLRIDGDLRSAFTGVNPGATIGGTGRIANMLGSGGT